MTNEQVKHLFRLTASGDRRAKTRVSGVAATNKKMERINNEHEKLILVATIGVALVGLLAAPAVMAAPGGKDNPSNDNPQSLYLYQKDASWNIVWGGAWGKYNYNLSGPTISGPFNGHGLVPGTEYTLVEYDGWPSVTVIGSGVADALGDVSIVGTTDVGASGEGGAGTYKIWLVLSSDVSGGSLVGWNPSSYLFEHNQIP